MANFYFRMEARFEKSDKTSLSFYLKFLNQKPFLYLFYNVKKRQKNDTNLSFLGFRAYRHLLFMNQKKME